jgi:hypothetical protein
MSVQSQFVVFPGIVAVIFPHPRRRRMKTILILLTALILCFAPGIDADMQSLNYRIPNSVLSGGGGAAGSSNYLSHATIGQSSPLMDPADPPYSANYDLYPGYWHTLIAMTVEVCEGDFNGDGDVDGSDLVVFAADFGRTDCAGGPLCEGDFNGDGDVDGSDLVVFAADFGRVNCP